MTSRPRYRPLAYWRDRGRTYERDFRPEKYQEQEEALLAVLASLDYSTVLEVGCGFGRIGSLIARPGVRYAGIDLSGDMLASARRRIPDGAFQQVGLAAFRPPRKWELVIAVEVLMHIPPGRIGGAVRRLRALSSHHVVTIDWTKPGPEPAEHNFCHDYGALLRPTRTVDVGMQTIHVLTR